MISGLPDHTVATEADPLHPRASEAGLSRFELNWPNAFVGEGSPGTVKRSHARGAATESLRVNRSPSVEFKSYVDRQVLCRPRP